MLATPPDRSPDHRRSVLVGSDKGYLFAGPSNRQQRETADLPSVRFSNQLRQKIGIVYGNPETTTGGNALKFYASVRLDIRKTGVIKASEEVVGTKARVKVVKNKVAPPFREAEFEILYGIGVNKLAEIVDLGEKAGLIDRAGNWYSYKGERLAQGRDKVIAYLAEHPSIAQEVRLLLVEGAKAECQMAPAAATVPNACPSRGKPSSVHRRCSSRSSGRFAA